MWLRTAHIIEDDAAVMEAFCALLGLEGFSCYGYESGWEFVRKAPDVGGAGVLIDVHADGALSEHVAQHLTEAIDRPVVVLTQSLATPAAHSFALKVGGAILFKPFVADELLGHFALVGKQKGSDLLH